MVRSSPADHDLANMAAEPGAKTNFCLNSNIKLSLSKHDTSITPILRQAQDYMGFCIAMTWVFVLR